MEYAASHQIRIFLHPQNYFLSHNGCAHEGQVSSRLGLTGIPESAETIALFRDLELIELTGVIYQIPKNLQTSCMSKF